MNLIELDTEAGLALLDLTSGRLFAYPHATDPAKTMVIPPVDAFSRQQLVVNEAYTTFKGRLSAIPGVTLEEL